MKPRSYVRTKTSSRRSKSLLGCSGPVAGRRAEDEEEVKVVRWAAAEMSDLRGILDGAGGGFLTSGWVLVVNDSMSCVA